MAHATCHQTGFNPLCGDKIVLHVQENNGLVQDLSFEGTGCAISIASASLMTEALKGKSVEEVKALFAAFQDVVMGVSTESLPSIGKLAVLAGVAEFPARVKCATLAWHTLNAALSHENKVVSTENDT